ncbi:hypothetical protein KP509_31G040800 [Ceratopteris richardii]|uniref:Uncharacterized protein n=1 Tax=Ceratopteris richardii TaxID=49495 RepID=A0A8T2QXK9_CERRI|nr:hypothetical protein KP509_31G040800 [Ceratopteris richardii]
MGRLSAADSSLPKVLGAPLLMWIQWAYAAWQLVRKNPLIILLASLPLHPILKRKRRIIMLGRPEEEEEEVLFEQLMANPSLRELVKMVRVSAQLRRHGATVFPEELWRGFEAELAQQETGEIKVHGYFGIWAKIDYTPRNQFYIVRLEALGAYLSLREHFKKHDVVFATNKLQVTGNVAVARRVSDDDAMDMIFTRTGHLANPSPYTFLTLVDSAEVNSTMWALLSWLPLYLQIHNHNKLANLPSLCVIFLDVNKAWIYHVYLAITFHRIKWIKLHVFKRRIHLYIFFSMFSSRWMYDDRVKCKAYETLIDDLLVVSDYCKFKSEEDIRFFNDGTGPFYIQEGDENITDTYYGVHIDRANVALMKRGNAYVKVIVNKRLFVP